MSIADAFSSLGNAVQYAAGDVTSGIAKAAETTSNAGGEGLLSAGAEAAAPAMATDSVDLSQSAQDEMVSDSALATEDQAGEVDADDEFMKNAVANNNGSNAQEEKVVTIGGSNRGSSFDITVNADGSYKVCVDGRESTYSKAEADRLVANGGRGNDTFNIHQADPKVRGNIEINAGKGNDTIKADSNVTSNLTLYGGDGNDTITGGAGNDFISGGKGNDVLDGGAGNDTIGGCAGNDTIKGGVGNDVLYGGKGDDVIDGGAGRDYIEGGDGSDVITGGAGGDVIYGGNGNDVIDGEGGNDFINAGAGNDEVHGGDGNDVIFGLSGNDTLHGDAGNDVLIGGKGADTIDGGAGADKIRMTYGDAGADTIYHSEAKDDIQALNPVKVPSNFKIDGDELERFQQNMKDNLEAFADCEPGQEMLNRYAATGHNITFQSTDEQNGGDIAVGRGDAANITENANGTRSWTPGAGTDSIVKINPSFINFSSHDAWEEQNTMVIMAHEMSHSYNDATGTADYSSYNTDNGSPMHFAEGTSNSEKFRQRAVPGYEFQAVGIYDNSTISANPYGISENDYRQYFNMPARLSYLSQNDAQRAQTAASNPLGQ